MQWLRQASIGFGVLVLGFLVSGRLSLNVSRLLEVLRRGWRLQLANLMRRAYLWLLGGEVQLRQTDSIGCGLIEEVWAKSWLELRLGRGRELGGFWNSGRHL